MRFSHERDLLDLPELHQSPSNRSVNSDEHSDMSSLQSPERMLFLPDDSEIGRARLDDPPTSASETTSLSNATTIMGEASADRTEENDHEQAPSDDNDDDDGSDSSSAENMFMVSVLRSAVAAAGGLAELPDVFVSDDE
ncbi:uncharacterized protein MYCFIDRAFT_203486 [Pseudocercospora fijiensis CIRAD86]|uniref:Uncharacterized protein n=1 Tax=Pseudocercospora fijiensis (strain CIRAD86) TaxID=383855 RepID=M3AEJ5_PSEFD|nr:uncharacterized protein MYCFIDRAFT_203486 [Pseudocercospora fijiensis CIRAD86]EME83026.1 hypothetical protein MYCFIDRAFT_203486 [Pseudocercospora fijiensis CIRAD86]